MATEVLLPKQGNTVESCIIIEWKKTEGDPVKAGDPLVEVETDKATLDVEATADGVLLTRLVAEGDDVPVLTPIAVIGEIGERGAAVSGRRKGPAISPRARRLAEQHGLDYSGVTGTGPGGRIMVKDVEALRAGGPAAAPAAAASDRKPAPAAAAASPARPASPAGGYDERPVTGVRKVIAERMRASLATTAQLTMHATADARRLLDYRARLKGEDDPQLAAVSLNDLVLFAVSRTLPAFAGLNATFEGGAIRTYRDVHLGFAVDTERGLMVPVIHNADRMSLVEIATEAHRLAEACQTSKARPEDLAGATFTITNLGALGIESFTPVLNPPQVGILGVCAIGLKPVAESGETRFVPHIGLSLTIDHQVVDGAPGARFLQALTRTLAHIDTALAR